MFINGVKSIYKSLVLQMEKLLHAKKKTATNENKHTGVELY